MDAVMGVAALAVVTLVALGTLGVRAVVAPHKVEQVVLATDVPAYHRLLLSDLAVQAKPKVDGSFAAVQLLAGRLTTHALEQGAVVRKTHVTTFTVSPGSTVVTVSVDSVPTGVRASQTVKVVSLKGEAAGIVLAQRPAKEGVSLQLIVDSLDAGRVAGQKVSLIVPTQ
ncbi:hypothetical protein [Deinococcus yunweiensis]|uniref:hypothetical protein n=1 Tax=Deinococcus yunweiensis TaxID=367282 RepID=UPI00398F3444